jgi:hypothetical protein
MTGLCVPIPTQNRRIEGSILRGEIQREVERGGWSHPQNSWPSKPSNLETPEKPSPSLRIEFSPYPLQQIYNRFLKDDLDPLIFPGDIDRPWVAVLHNLRLSSD